MGKTTTVLCSSDIDGRYVSVNLLDQSLLHTDPNNFLLTICELEVYEGKWVFQQSSWCCCPEFVWITAHHRAFSEKKSLGYVSFWFLFHPQKKEKAPAYLVLVWIIAPSLPQPQRQMAKNLQNLWHTPLHKPQVSVRWGHHIVSLTWTWHGCGLICEFLWHQSFENHLHVGHQWTRIGVRFLGLSMSQSSPDSHVLHGAHVTRKLCDFLSRSGQRNMTERQNWRRMLCTRKNFSASFRAGGHTQCKAELILVCDVGALGDTQSINLLDKLSKTASALTGSWEFLNPLEVRVVKFVFCRVGNSPPFTLLQIHHQSIKRLWNLWESWVTPRVKPPKPDEQCIFCAFHGCVILVGEHL